MIKGAATHIAVATDIFSRDFSAPVDE